MIREQPATMFHAACNLCGRVAREGTPTRYIVLPKGWERFDVTDSRGEVRVVHICKNCLAVLGVEGTDEGEEERG